ncbi:hypothetical protein [Microbacterium rhizophilus]|uniref:hypothetical protein n=1 Tax=Microbacterium rhizophilus TaxID=3138934 RepID=UPI0031EBAA7B
MSRGLRIRAALEHVALVLLGLGGPFAYAMASPIYSSGDEAAHVDYALQVWHGHLPVFEDGLELRNAVGVHPPVQWTSHHPPLLYLLLSPFVGPLADAGHIEAAGMAGRFVMVALSVVLLYTVRGIGRLLVPDVAGVGLASALVVGLSVWFVRLGGSVYTDTLAALVSALAFYALLRLARGTTPVRDSVLFALACAGCALSRFSLLPVAILFAVAAIVIGHLPGPLRPRHAWLAAVAAGVAVVGSSLWFYLRNIALTGNASGGHPDWAAEHTSRVARPAPDVAADPSFWTVMSEQFSVGTYPALPRALEASWPWTLLLFALPTLVGIVLFVVRALRGRGDRAVRIVLLLTALAVCGGVAIMQILHTAGGGSAFARYFFAMLPFLAPLLVLPLLWLRGLPLVAWTLARAILLGLEIAATLARQLRGAQAAIYPEWTWLGFGVAIAGAVLALAVLVGRRRRTEPA